MAASAESVFPDYGRDLDDCKEIMQTTKYRGFAEEVAKSTRRIVFIEIDDIEAEGKFDLARRMEKNTNRYVELFSVALDDALKTLRAQLRADTTAIDSEDVVDVMQKHRAQQMAADGDEIDSLPARLVRRYDVRILPATPTEKGFTPRAIREVKALDIGSLVTVQAMVTRSSDVKPLITVATYTCDVCGYEIYHDILARSFLPLKECPSEKCRANSSKGRLNMQTRGSKFIKYQEVKIQELPDQVPVGHIPRAMTLIARGELTRSVLPGDLVTVDGVFLPTPYTGFKAMKAGLIADTYLEAHRITKMKKTSNIVVSSDVREKLDALEADPDLYSKLARSIAPEIYGHEDVKKALLLQLVGGVTLDRRDGMRIRGDINVCLMGDPGVAKSQLLKHITHVAPRAVYTTGKGSSGVGLTAAVMKDPITGEMMLEGGALVLADMGICCIDEFDKMEDADRTAIHEVMEQQTVSIAKAGITTTLNARTSILAAANPLYGRYNPKAAADPHTALLRNVNLPAALLSRFDLLFLILDKPDQAADEQLARHVTHVHQKGRAPALGFDPISPQVLRAYCVEARDVRPFVPSRPGSDLTNLIVQSYVDLRQNDAGQAADNRTILTARQLLSILRMAQAHARLHHEPEVREEDVREAIRLVTMSKASIISSKEPTEHVDPVSQVFRIIMDYFKSHGATSAKRADVEHVVRQRRFTVEQMDTCLQQYQDIGLLDYTAAADMITLANPDM